ncbi:probable staphylococcal-like nuclease CAN1 isoform X2 [Phragmites australis]|uniref:probable staphylococcal-like nuclease CAN1 isoform X2 n=1 Tax=Phragmites australis TaxID=29695 RepID=UPI002D797F67|nr:probable staphylococcal-like nuclease CAN1 isoform X2 [Phragmites australis]
MHAAPRRRREGRGFHVRGGVGDEHARLAPVLLHCIGAIALLAGAGRTLFPKERLCLGSSWYFSLASVAQTFVPKSQGVKYELHTLPVDVRAVTDGDTITVYVDIADHLESGNVPRDVLEAAAERAKARAAKNFQGADAMQKIILDAGYRQVPNMRGEQVLAKKYRIRGIDAPESFMPYGKEAKEELVKLVQGKSLKISIYDSDRYGRLVGDVECDGVFVQEHMLKKGFAWHYTAYDHRVELNKWENQAKASRTGLWASPNPEKPWEWRKQKRIGTV